jgi:O-antigen ligase
MRNVTASSQIFDQGTAGVQEIDSSLDVTPDEVEERKYTASLLLFTAALFLTPFLFGGRSDVSASVIRGVFLLFFLVRALCLTYAEAMAGKLSFFRALKFFPYPEANRYFLYFVPLLLFAGFQSLPLPYPVLSMLSPMSAEAYLQAGAFDPGGPGVGYLSLDPRATRNGFLWILVCGILGAELLSFGRFPYIYSSRRGHGRKGRRNYSTSRRNSGSADFAESSRTFDFYAEYFISCLILLALVCSLVSIFHLASRSEMLFGIFSPEVNFLGHSRAHWPFVSPNHLAVVLEAGLILSFLNILRDRQMRGLSVELREDEPFMGRMVRVIRQWENQAKEIVTFLVILLGLFLTGSRAGISISLGAISVLWLYYKLFPVSVMRNPVRLRRSSSLKRRRNINRSLWLQMILFPLVLVSIAFFFMGDSSRNQLASRIETGIQEGLDIGRRQLQGISMDVFSASPVWGVGLNAWRQLAPRYAGDALAPWELDYAHNEYLQFLAEFGLVGSLMLLLPLGYLVSGSIRRIRENNFFSRLTNAQKFYLLGTFLCVLVPLLHAWVDFPLHMPGVCFAIIAGCIIFTRTFTFYLAKTDKNSKL